MDHYAQFEALLNTAPLGVHLVDEDFRIQHVNPIALPFFKDLPDLIGRDFDEVVHIVWEKERADDLVVLFRHTLNTGEAHHRHEWAQFHENLHTPEYYEWRIDRIGLPEGRRGVVCYCWNISAQVRARQAIADRERKLHHFVHDLQVVVEKRTQELVSARDRLRALATELNLTEERERKRLATELHDHLQQILALGRLQLSQAEKEAVAVPICARTIQRVDGLLSEALQYTRTLVAELIPPILKEQGLPAALGWLGEYMKKYNVQVSVKVADAFSLRVPEEHAGLLFQSVRELLINISKHAKTDRAFVTMRENAEHLMIQVRDNGAGCILPDADVEDETLPDARSYKFGLFSVRERMKALGGSFDIASAPGHGTTATLLLPGAPAISRNSAQGLS